MKKQVVERKMLMGATSQGMDWMGDIMGYKNEKNRSNVGDVHKTKMSFTGLVALSRA